VSLLKLKSKQRKILVLIGVLLILLISVIILQHSGFISSRILNYIVNYLEQKQKVSLTAQSFDINLFRLEFTLRGVEIRKLEDGYFPPFFRAEKIKINIPLSLLLSRKLHIQEIDIQNPKIHILISKDGKTNLPSSVDAEKINKREVKVPEFILNQFYLHSGHLIYSDQSKGIYAELPAIRMNMAWMGKGQHSILLEIQEKGHVRYGQNDHPINTFTGQAVLSRERINLKEFVLRVAKSEIRLSGLMEGLLSPVFNIEIQADILMGDWEPFLSTDRILSGMIHLRSRIQGTIDALAARMKIKGEDISLDGGQDVEIEADLSWKNSLLEISSLRMAGFGGEAWLKGELHPLNWEEGNRIEFLWESLNLEEVSLFFEPRYNFLSRASGSGEVSWIGLSWDKIKGQADIRLNAMKGSREAPRSIPLSGRFSAQADSGEIQLDIKELFVQNAKLSGNVQAGSALLSGRFHFETQNIGEHIPDFSYYGGLNTQQVQTLSPTGQLSIAGELGGSFDSPKIEAVLKGRGISFKSHEDFNLDGKIEYDSGRLNFEDFVIRDDENRIQVSGVYPLGAGSRSMSFDVSAKGFSVDKIMEAFPPSIRWRPKGRADVEIAIRGEPENPRAETSVVFHETSLGNQAFERAELSASYQEKKITIEKLNIEKSGGWLRGDGWYDITNKRYSLDLSATSFQIQGWPLGEPEAGFSAEVHFQIRGRGMVESPRLDASGILKNVLYDSKELGDIRFQTKASEEELDYEIFLPMYSGAVKGSVRLSKPYPLTGELTFDDLAFLRLREWVPIDERVELDGSLGGGLRIRMDIVCPEETLDIRARIEKFLIKATDFQLTNDGPILISYDSDALAIDSLILVGPGTRIKAEGGLSFKNSSDSGIRLDTDVDLSLVSNFFSHIEARGTLKSRLRANGSLSDLELSGAVDAQDVDVSLTTVPLHIKDIRLNLEIAKNTISIKSANFTWEKGRYEAKGDVPLESLPFDLPGKFQAFGNRSANVSLAFQGADLSGVTPLIPTKPLQKIGGKFDGTVEIKGETLRLADISSEAVFSLLELNLFGMTLIQDQPTQILMEDGRIIVTRFNLSGDRNRVFMEGTVDPTSARSSDILIGGELELSGLQGLLEGGFVSGKSQFEVQMTGDIRDPVLQGFFEVQNGEFQMSYPRLSLNQVVGRIQADQNRIEIEHFRGDLNEGILDVKGSILLEKWAVKKSNIQLKTANALFDFAKDLYSQISSDLNLESDGMTHYLKGRILINEARYSERLNVESALFRFLRRGAPITTLKEPDQFLSNLNLDVAVGTVNNFLIDNNISKSEFFADLRLTGTVYNPALSGRVLIVEGGEIYFSQNTFIIERGTADFINPAMIEPDLNLNARTRVHDYDIQLILTGTPSQLTASLVSEPPLSEPNIISLLVTGKTLESASSSILGEVGNKALSYINNALTGRIEQALTRVLGLESVRIDASLVSTEENPSARITVGQRIRRNFELVFSQDMKDAQNRTWIINYNPMGKVNLQGTKRDNNEFNLALRHELNFGLRGKMEREFPGLISQGPFVVEDIRVEGALGIPEKKIREKIQLREGKRFDFYKLQQSLDRIRRLYQKNNFLSLALETRKEEENSRLNLVFRIESGPKIFIKYEGADVPKRIRKEIVETWMGTSFGQLVKEDIRQRLRLHFLNKRYYQVSIQATESEEKNEVRIIHFRIDKGIRFDRPLLEYSGNRYLSEDSLTSFLKKNHLISSLFDPSQKAAQSIENVYIQTGFLRPEVQLSTPEFTPETNRVKIEFTIKEGPRFRIDRIIVNGSRFLSEEKIIKAVAISSGDIVNPERLEEADRRVKDIYAKSGFNQVNVQSRAQVNEAKNSVDLIFEITENQQGKVEDIRISGNSATRAEIIQRELMLRIGDVVDFRKINESRKKLYDLGIFERVHIEVKPVELAQPLEESIKPYLVEIDVVELRPYRLRYGLQFDTDSSFGVSSDLINRNFLRNAYLLGMSARLNRDERDVRGYFRTPYFFSKKINTEFFTFVNRSIKPAFTVDRIGFTLQQQIELKKSNILSYNYTFERNHTFDHNLDSTFHMNMINLAFTRDTRDSLLNATKGMFLSQNIGYAPKILGSDISFVRYFGQYFTYKRLNDFLLYAAGVRIGLGKGIGQDLIPSERFFAGGGATIRGFAKDEVGPRNLETGEPLGGDAVFILNQELRFPLYKILSGAVFLDIGNAYPRISDLNPFDVRDAAGFGFRLVTPFVLMRFDWGFKLDRRPGESRSRIFFSIGQAF